jgi:hypothetical protein
MEAVTLATAQQVTQHRTAPALRTPKLPLHPRVIPCPQPTAQMRPSLSMSTGKRAPQQITHHISPPPLQPTLNSEAPLLAMLQAHIPSIPEVHTVPALALAIALLQEQATNNTTSAPLMNNMNNGGLLNKVSIGMGRVAEGAGIQTLGMMVGMGSRHPRMTMEIFMTTGRLQSSLCST